MSKFYISDLHLGHEKAIKFDRRPFKSTQEMQEVIIGNWNSVVGSTDDVYILGDMFWDYNEAPKILEALNGNKFLILGNHDRVNSDMKKYFVWIKDYAEIKDGDEHVVLCHYPIAHWKNADYGAIHLYGHIHAGRDTRPFDVYKAMMKQCNVPYECYNVGCMMPYMGYTPRTLNQIRQYSFASSESSIIISEINSIKSNMQDIQNNLEVVKNYEEISSDQAENIATAAKARIISLLGGYEKKYFGRFIRRLYSDAKKNHYIGNTISRTHKSDYQRALGYIEAWYPDEGITELKRKGR